MKKVTLKNGFTFIGKLVNGSRESGAMTFEVDSNDSREINPCYSYRRELVACGIVAVGLWVIGIAEMINC